MSEETAQTYARARRNGVYPSEAWADLGALAAEIDWDVERMLSESDSESDGDGVSDHEVSQ